MKFVNVGNHSWACVGGGDDVHHSFGANQGFVQTDTRCLVIDSGFHNRTASQVLDRISKARPEQIVLVDTHYHSDHVFGNSVFARKGAAVVSHWKCRRRMKAMSEGLLAKYRGRDAQLSNMLRGVEVSLPSITYKDMIVAVLDDGVEAEVVHPGTRAHTDGDTMVYVPGDRVVFAGDILWNMYHPNLEDSNIQGQVRSLKMILKWNPRKVVPGHGPVGGLAEVRRFIRYLEELDKNLRNLAGEDLSLEETTSRAIPAWTREWKMRRLAESYVRKVWKNTSRRVG